MASNYYIATGIQSPTAALLSGRFLFLPARFEFVEPAD